MKKRKAFIYQCRVQNECCQFFTVVCNSVQSLVLRVLINGTVLYRLYIVYLVSLYWAI